MTSTRPEGVGAAGPVLLAYDGGGLSALAIERAGLQLEKGREALVVCVWQPADVGFTPIDGTSFDAGNTAEVRAAAERTAAHGAALAEAAGFRAQGLTVEGSPTWKGIVGTAEERGRASSSSAPTGTAVSSGTSSGTSLPRWSRTAPATCCWCTRAPRELHSRLRASRSVFGST